MLMAKMWAVANVSQELHLGILASVAAPRRSFHLDDQPSASASLALAVQSESETWLQTSAREKQTGHRFFPHQQKMAEQDYEAAAQLDSGSGWTHEKIGHESAHRREAAALFGVAPMTAFDSLPVRRVMSVHLCSKRAARPAYLDHHIHPKASAVQRQMPPMLVCENLHQCYQFEVAFVHGHRHHDSLAAAVLVLMEVHLKLRQVLHNGHGILAPATWRPGSAPEPYKPEVSHGICSQEQGPLRKMESVVMSVGKNYFVVYYLYWQVVVWMIT